MYEFCPLFSPPCTLFEPLSDHFRPYRSEKPCQQNTIRVNHKSRMQCRSLSTFNTCTSRELVHLQKSPPLTQRAIGCGGTIATVSSLFQAAILLPHQHFNHAIFSPVVKSAPINPNQISYPLISVSS